MHERNRVSRKWVPKQEFGNQAKIDRTKGGKTPGIDMGFLLYDVNKRRQPAVPHPIGPRGEEESKP